MLSILSSILVILISISALVWTLQVSGVNYKNNILFIFNWFVVFSFLFLISTTCLVFLLYQGENLLGTLIILSFTTATGTKFFHLLYLGLSFRKRAKKVDKELFLIPINTSDIINDALFTHQHVRMGRNF